VGIFAANRKSKIGNRKLNGGGNEIRETKSRHAAEA
jgi:hypothetical protein